jgi:hypothetical protein
MEYSSIVYQLTNHGIQRQHVDIIKGCQPTDINVAIHPLSGVIQ